MTSHQDNSTIASLRRQLAEARGNLLLIQERKTEFVEATRIPLDLIQDERRTEKLVEELEQHHGQRLLSADGG